MTVTGGNRVRAWATTIVVLLSTLLSGTLPTSMVWSGSPTVCADVAVTVAVNPDHAPTAHLLDYRITAGHSHGPPTAINGPAPNGHTYYVLAGDTPVLAHNAGCDEWADAFISASGGQKVTFTPPAGGRVFPEGTYLNQPPGEAWFHHTVVVRGGKVFDQWNPNGISIQEYKAQWGDMADEIDFGF